MQAADLTAQHHFLSTDSSSPGEASLPELHHYGARGVHGLVFFLCVGLTPTGSPKMGCGSSGGQPRRGDARPVGRRNEDLGRPKPWPGAGRLGAAGRVTGGQEEHGGGGEGRLDHPRAAARAVEHPQQAAEALLMPACRCLGGNDFV